ncbi:MAG: hypothetical protein KGS72_19440 [Cyanobacteria bacterium REEB67]|nr:hypothetical protein [Cyanobacteria bacterium REEB67]
MRELRDWFGVFTAAVSGAGVLLARSKMNARLRSMERLKLIPIFQVGSNKTMSLKRHPALQPFSREHLTGLFHAHQLMWLSNGRARQDLLTTVTNFKQAWEDEIFFAFR